MSHKVLQPDALVLPDGICYGAQLEVAGGRIQAVHKNAQLDGAERLAGTLLPGLVDLQVNGAGGRSVDEICAADGTAALDHIARCMAEQGAAAFLPTIISQAIDPLCAQLAALAAWIPQAPADGARPLGIHLEGPFLRNAGAHDEGVLRDPEPRLVAQLLEAAAGQLRLVTLAPSRQGAPAATAQLVEAGVCVSLGHDLSAAGLDACVAAGARMATHLFNAMGKGDHRHPGLAQRVMDCPQLSAGLILDRVHVHEVLVRQAQACMGAERLLLTTDCVGAMGMPDGDYELAGQRVTLREGVVRNGDGTLAGAALSPLQSAANYLAMVPTAGPWSLSRAGAANPAALIGAEDFGALAPGRVARFLLLDERGPRPLHHD